MTIEVVSVDSDACDLENLGAMADMSGGTVTRVKASELATNFAGILANPILASQVRSNQYEGKGAWEIGRGSRAALKNFDYPRTRRSTSFPPV